MIAKYRRVGSRKWEDCIILEVYSTFYFVLRWDGYPVDDYSRVIVPTERIRLG